MVKQIGEHDVCNYESSMLNSFSTQSWMATSSYNINHFSLLEGGYTNGQKSKETIRQVHSLLKTGQEDERSWSMFSKGRSSRGSRQEGSQNRLVRVVLNHCAN